jgi:hypothetical protein
MPSGTTGVEALAAGEVEILSVPGTTAVAAALSGADGAGQGISRSQRQKSESVCRRPCNEDDRPEWAYRYYSTSGTWSIRHPDQSKMNHRAYQAFKIFESSILLQR